MLIYAACLWQRLSKEVLTGMTGRLRPYLPELSIRDYNTYLRYMRGVRYKMYCTYGLYSCHCLRHNGVLFALLSDSLAGREATCRLQRLPGTLYWKKVMCQTQGINLASQAEVLLQWHRLHDHSWEELSFKQKIHRVLDDVFLSRANEQAVEENPTLERLFVQEKEQHDVIVKLNTHSYTAAAEPMSNVFGALYSILATDDPSQRKSMRYIGSCLGRAFYLIRTAESFDEDKKQNGYNVFIVNGINSGEAAQENARRQALAAANDLVRAYSMLDIKLNKSLLDNIMILGLRHAVDPLEHDIDIKNWEVP